MNKYITMVGSRETPQHILEQMENIAHALGNRGYIIRSGGADGADTAAENGAITGGAEYEIYLPWKNFNGNQSFLYLDKLSNRIQAVEYARMVHPVFDGLSDGAQKLHTRNVYQVLGQDLKTPSQFLICWTPNGKTIGGTATAIRLAEKFNVPICNLAKDEWKGLE